MARRRLVDGARPGSADGWHPVDDVVMGGRSRSRVEPGDGVLAFAGHVSLENGGGFASVRTEARNWGAAGAVTFVLRVRGDGRRYKLALRTGEAFDGLQYQAAFQPGSDWSEIAVPVAAFVATFRGRAVAGAPALDPAQVRTLGLVVGERQAGEFRLEVASIDVE
jgi:nucleotide-binding universal stress UspA family protein